MARHSFAFFVDQLFEKGPKVTINNPESLRRIQSIVRLREGDTVELFNREESVRGVIATIEKRSFVIAVQQRKIISNIKPELLVLLPMLKKDDAEEALLRLCAVGATTIQLVETEKVQRAWHFEREKERFERVMIAACEQSKQFMLPELRAPISLEQACAALQSDTQKIFFDPDGRPLLEVLQQVANHDGPLALLVGPEGDLTDKEKESIKQQGFVFCALTPTILRSCEAIALGAGVVRSLHHQA